MFIETESWKGIVNKNLLKKSQNKLHHIKDKVIADQSKFSFLRNDNNSEIFRILNKVKKKFLNLDKLILIGTGGSSLGSKAFLSILNSKRVTFLENIDPRTLDILITKYSKKKIGLIIISKSGETIEVLTLYDIIINKLKSNINLKNNSIIISDNKDSTLSSIANSYGIEFIEHDDKIGGRYSCFSITGLLPMHLSGYNASKVKKLADSCFHDALIEDKYNNLLSINILSNLIKQKKYTGHVFLVYLDNFYQLAKWYRQLWNESIGKKGLGLHLITASGAIDQHSELQMWMDGPKNLIFTIIIPRIRAKELKVKNPKNILPSYLTNKNIGEILNIMGIATATELKRVGIPVRLIYIDNDDIEEGIRLMTMLILEVSFIAKLIGVNPFDQPAVESIKSRTINLLKKNARD